MYNSNIPTDQEIPSTGKLIRSTIIAAVVAAVLLVTVVMPAEYGIDPTGIGNVIGLKRMGEIKTSLAKEAAVDKAHNVGTVSAESDTSGSTGMELDFREDEMKVTLAQDESTEIKLSMVKGGIVEYKWRSDGGKAFFDTHADSKSVNYHGYGKGTEQGQEGELKAAFSGNHGWYWKNRNSETITITLEVIGEYSDIKQMK